jgi:predicted nucleic acid-binding protein
MTRGRSPSRAVYSLDEPTLTFPREVVLDTSFVIDALLQGQPRHDECTAFLRRLAEQEVAVFFNRLLEVELLEATYRLVLKERFGRAEWRRRRLDGRARRRASRLTRELLEAWNGALRALNHSVVELDEVVSGIAKVMAQYGLSSYDAVHMATALRMGVRSMVTLDSGFAAIPAAQLELFVSSRQVSYCRSVRASHQ